MQNGVLRFCFLLHRDLVHLLLELFILYEPYKYIGDIKFLLNNTMKPDLQTRFNIRRQTLSFFQRFEGL